MTDTDVLDALRNSLDGVTLRTPAEQIMAAGRARRRTRRAITATGSVAAAATVAAGIAVPLLSHPSTAPPAPTTLHVQEAAFTLDARADGTIQVTWDKDRYFRDHAGLEAALRRAGFPVLIKEGVFCHGAGEAAPLDPHGVGPGVRPVMMGQRDGGGGKSGGNTGGGTVSKDALGPGGASKAGGDRVTFVFDRTKLPPGRRLFIGYLTPAQLAVTGGRPGSVERLIPATGPLTCTTQAPPRSPR
ncbi:hypothetical protein [Actinomadura parmotrematis]|uniref:PASTA domain-containing protein n=1 Tax=Actinomadura parmotrematis TaxID=2864039 RepID=A0ABS7FYV9_9ACTN|nr:hypothetical protein [Actinomadura parmotrematis]MBW8484767.1 hypothetical protein [Actinomadura parmotrematis]